MVTGMTEGGVVTSGEAMGQPARLRGGVDTIADQPLTCAWYAKFMASHLLAVGFPRLWGTH